MQVTVGMPVFNGQASVSRALLSLRQQTHRDIRIAVVDNQSDDRTREIVRSHERQDERVFLIEAGHAPASINFQRALDQCSSDFFMWAAHDDLWHPTYIERSLAALGEDFDYCSPNWWVGMIDDYEGTGTPLHPLPFISSSSRRARVLSFINLHHSSHKCNIVYSLFKSELIREALTRQDVADDGALGAVLCGLARGATCDDQLFFKDYGSRGHQSRRIVNRLASRLRPRQEASFDQQKAASLARLEGLFPEYRADVRRIFTSYLEYGSDSVLDAQVQQEVGELLGEPDR
jgi:glycosyltransferase involved in cell wall biosynthesis